MKFFTAASLFLLMIPMTAAAGSLLSLDVEPIVGYERNQKLIPTQHTTDRLVYGARVAVGVPLLKLEAEYTRGTDTESFPDDSLTVKDIDDKVKVGAKTQLKLSRLFNFIIRGGVQAKQNTHTETQDDVSTTVINPIVYKPYGGAGLTAGLGRKLQLTGGMTVVFGKFPDMKQNDYQTTLGFTVKLP